MKYIHTYIYIDPPSHAGTCEDVELAVEGIEARAQLFGVAQVLRAADMRCSISDIGMRTRHSNTIFPFKYTYQLRYVYIYRQGIVDIHVHIKL